MWDRKELKQRGKAAFKANYWMCVLVAFLLVLATASAGTAAGNSAKNQMNQNDFNFSFNSTGSGSTYTVNDQSFSSIQDVVTAVGEQAGANPEDVANVNELITAIQTDPDAKAAIGIAMAFLGVVFAVVLVVGFLLNLLLFKPLEVGCRGFFTRNSESPAELSEISAGFRPYGRTVGAMFLRGLFLSLWSLLFIIPGIIKAYSYRMVPYILADDPTIGGKDAITLSRQMMDGQKWKTFVLDLSFIGWAILSVFTFGILGVFYVKPYKCSTDAELYRALKNQ